MEKIISTYVMARTQYFWKQGTIALLSQAVITPSMAGDGIDRVVVSGGTNTIIVVMAMMLYR